MSLLLGIETATEVCSVALGRNGVVLHELHYDEPNRHASHLHVLIKTLLQETGFSLKDLGAIVISKGPGSYTGLRVGVSAAKGLCYALDLPLVAIDSLQSMANRIMLHHPTDAELLVPMIDARRMEVYATVTDRQLQVMEPTAAKILDAESYLHLLSSKVVLFAGNGAGKLQPLLQNETNARFLPDFTCGADGLILPAEQLLKKGKTESVAYFEPYYLKDFVGTTPKNRI